MSAIKSMNGITPETMFILENILIPVYKKRLNSVSPKPRKVFEEPRKEFKHTNKKANLCEPTSKMFVHINLNSVLLVTNSNIKKYVLLFIFPLLRRSYLRVTHNMYYVSHIP